LLVADGWRLGNAIALKLSGAKIPRTDQRRSRSGIKMFLRSTLRILSGVLPYFVGNSRIVDDQFGYTNSRGSIFASIHSNPYCMSDIFKKFKSVFIVDDGSAPTVTIQGDGKAQQPAVSVSPAPVAATGSVSNKFMEILSGALEKNNQEGFDYFEFRQSLKNLAKMPMDESTRFQSAFAMAQTMNVTPEKLIESAKLYLTVLNSEQSKFAEAHVQQRAKLIGNREEEIKNLEGMIQQKTEQIQQLTQQIEEHRQRSKQVRDEVNDSTVKIETTKADFETTFSNVTANIQADIAKMQQYLK